MSTAHTLTAFEVVGLRGELNLADGHAYQDLAAPYEHVITDLPALWTASELTPVPEAEERFRNAFATLAGCAGMRDRTFFKICPSASNSIDVIGAVLSELKRPTTLIEPTFDNLPLLLRRRGVLVRALSEEVLRAEGSVESGLCEPGEALFLVQPNNPTGHSLSAAELVEIAMHCRRLDAVLVLDNSFRFFNRQPFDDYTVLADTGVSFLALEDTGKVWPTHDLKASLLFCSADLQELVSAVYDETYLCNSRFTLLMLERFLNITRQVGLAESIWRTVDSHRALLRRELADTMVTVDQSSHSSQISVEWLNCRATGYHDFDIAQHLAGKGVLVLPGRLFFWESGGSPERQFNIRAALMKPTRRFEQAVAILTNTLQRLGKL
ncbi:MAG TPA: aminotransferase class I/II-fold pyridoxal phosphate-dependent enzyme [Thermoanaerobaculia bacterium]|nr:aminotransferase class I/II-fold pyridoxal phosphate-dependent enzyme [Thermoanaerobaculia bacterium]